MTHEKHLMLNAIVGVALIDLKENPIINLTYDEMEELFEVPAYNFKELLEDGIMMNLPETVDVIAGLVEHFPFILSDEDLEVIEKIIFGDDAE